MYFIKIICSWCQPYHNLARCGCNQKSSWLFDPKTRYRILLQHIENPTYGMDGFSCVSFPRTMMASLMVLKCTRLGSVLVRMSATLVGPLIHLILKEPCLNSSKMNCIRYEICFVLPCSKHPFMIISWQALESIARVGTPSDFHCGIISLISFRTFVVQRISLTASVVAINSASAEDSATVGCFFDAQAIRVSLRKTVNPVEEWNLTCWSEKEESANVVTLVPPFFETGTPISIVPAKYRPRWQTASQCRILGSFWY